MFQVWSVMYDPEFLSCTVVWQEYNFISKVGLSSGRIAFSRTLRGVVFPPSLRFTRGERNDCFVLRSQVLSCVNACFVLLWRLQTWRSSIKSTSKGKQTFFYMITTPIEWRDHFCSHLICFYVYKLSQKTWSEDTDLHDVSSLCLACTVLNVNQKIYRIWLW